MPIIEIEKIPERTGSIYPAPHDQAVAGRRSIRLGDAGGLTQFGANIVILPPGSNASMRHWHVQEDEFLMMLDGELVLVDNDGAHLMKAGDCAAFPAGDPNGHRMENHSNAEARFLVVGTKSVGEIAHYPDTGLRVEFHDGQAQFFHADGQPYEVPKE